VEFSYYNQIPENTTNKIQELKNLLENCLINFPVTLPFKINNYTSVESILNFLSIQSNLIKFYKDHNLIDTPILTSQTTTIILNSKLKYFFKIKNSTLLPNLDQIVQNHTLDTHKIQQVICNLSLETKITILNLIKKEYCFINGSLFTGLLLLDIQSAINTDLYNFEHNPIETITLDGIYIDYQNIINSTQNLKYYLDIIVTGKKIENQYLQNSIFYLISQLHNFINVNSSFWRQFHQLEISDENQLGINLIKSIPGFLYNLFLKTPEGFNQIKNNIQRLLNTYVLENQLVYQDLLIQILQNTDLNSEKKSKILQFTNQSKIKRHKYRLLNIFLLISYLQINTNYHHAVNLFLEKQDLTNNGAEKFAKLSKEILNGSRITESSPIIQALTPLEIIEDIKSDTFKKTLNLINLDETLENIEQEKKDKISEIIAPLSYLIQENNIESIKQIILSHMLSMPEVIKVHSSFESQYFDRRIITQFLNPIYHHSQNSSIYTCFHLTEVFHTGHFPEVTCINHVNGSHKEELLALALLNDRVLVQARYNKRIKARAIMKLIKSKSRADNYGILLDNFYGSPDYILKIYELIKFKAKKDGFSLLLPTKVNNDFNQKTLEELISHITFYRSTHEYSLDFTSNFSGNQTDITSKALIEILD